MSRRGFLLSLILLVFVTQSADAFIFRLFRRGRRSSVSVNVRIGGSPQQICQQKAQIQANRGGRCFHPGGSFGGCRYEGVGSGATAAQALNNCCYTGQRRCAASAVVRGRNGRYYACKLFY
jgi:hypothetical protein